MTGQERSHDPEPLPSEWSLPRPPQWSPWRRSRPASRLAAAQSAADGAEEHRGTVRHSSQPLPPLSLPSPSLARLLTSSFLCSSSSSSDACSRAHLTTHTSPCTHHHTHITMHTSPHTHHPAHTSPCTGLNKQAAPLPLPRPR